jgi:hypothetical protein
MPDSMLSGAKITVQSTKKHNSVLWRAKNKVESTKMADFLLSTYDYATSGLLNLQILSGVP